MVQTLEIRRLLAADPVITEFMAKTGSTLTDGFGNESDWIEITNRGDASIDLAGWHLSDAANLAKWTFPSFTLAPGQIKVVFASSLDTTDPAGNLHTNFSLSQDGELLTLSRPDSSIVSQFNYPAQLEDVSYGTAAVYDRNTLVGPSATKRVLVPTNGTLDAGQWTAAGYDDSGWISGTKGVGYDTGGFEVNAVPPALVRRWAASSLNLANNATISTWTDSVNGKNATASGSPKYIASGINGKPVVRFTPSDGNDLLRVAANANPISNAEDFSIVVVFKANSGTGTQSQWYNNAGIVDAEVSGSTNDWGLSITSNSNGGRVGAGIGAPDTTVYNSTNLIGSAHVAVMTRKGGTLTLYVDGGNGFTTAVSSAARVSSDFVFGALQTNINYFNGDIAEVRMYSGAMNSTVAYNISSGLAGTYGLTVTAPTNTMGGVVNGNWTADTLNGLSDGAAVTAWSSSVGTRNAAASGAPILKKNQLNGHSVIRFNPTDGTLDSLRVAASANPLSNIVDFSVAVVFRTSVLGAGDETNWYVNSGIVDSEVGGQTNDWGLGFNSFGEVGAGTGNPDKSVYSQPGLNDGQAHVAVFTRSGSTISLYIDGGESFSTEGSTNARNSIDLVFGAIQTNIQYFNGDIAEIKTWNGALTEDGAHFVAGELADKYGVALGSDRYDSLIGVDVEASMFGNATTALVRVPFNVLNPSQYDQLLLSMQYDDAFIAYLNGTEVARSNFTGTGSYTSVADAARLDADAENFQEFDISGFRNLLMDGANVLSFRVINSALTDPDLLLVPQLIASTATYSDNAYMKPATPGAANGEGYMGYLHEPTFSVPHGIYTTAFNVTASAVEPGVTLVYTLDGSVPTLTNGIVVAPANASAINSVTLNVNKSSTLRVGAFKNMYIPAPVGTSTYIFVNSVLTQPNTAPAGAAWDTEVDPDVVNATQTYSVTQALYALPTMSIVMSYNELFGSSGIYRNTRQSGRAWERQNSIEYFDPNGGTIDFQVDSGVRIQGGEVRDVSNPKQSFRLYFRGEYGLGALDAPGLFGAGNPVTSYDHLVLKAGHNYAIANDTNALSEGMRDQFARDVQLGLSGYGVRGKFVNLYLNGQYWGVYNLMEDPDERWASAYQGGTKENYDIIEHNGVGGVEVNSGSIDAWNTLFSTLDTAYSDSVINDAEYAAISQLTDVTSLVDYMLSIFYRGDRDAPVLIGSSTDPRNFLAFRRADTNGKFYWQTWDGELGMDDVNFDRTEVAGNQNPARLFNRLRTNAEFKQLVTDEIYRLFYNDGPFRVSGGVNKPVEIYNNIVNQMNVAVVGESARWGDSKRSTPYMRDTNWLYAVNWLRNTYMPARTGVVLSQLAADFPMSSRLPAQFYVSGVVNRGGIVPTGSGVTLTDLNSSTAGDTIYYTLDGTDPRTSGGGVSSSAIAYSGAIPITSTKTITLRVLNGTTWSAKDSATYVVETVGLRLTEINFQPVAGTYSAGEYEYLEFYNGNTQPLDISGYKVTTGIVYTFPSNTILAAGEYIVVAKNVAAFQSRYGTATRVVGPFTSGSLANEGEPIVVTDALNNTIHSFTYLPTWYPLTAGGGYTLVIRDPLADKSVWNTAAGWRPSQNVNGSPGVVDPDSAPTGTVTAVTPSPRNTGVASMQIKFSEPVTGIDLADLVLSRSGGANLLTATQTLTTSDGGMTWTLGSLASLTSIDGTYTLSIAAGHGITDLTNHALTGSTPTTSFVVDATPPALVSSEFLLTAGVPQIRFTYNETLSARRQHRCSTSSAAAAERSRRPASQSTATRLRSICRRRWPTARIWRRSARAACRTRSATSRAAGRRISPLSPVTPTATGRSTSTTCSPWLRTTGSRAAPLLKATSTSTAP
ncbi:MAG: lamin tail domain-containing protein [Tepidisphaeraceae bacterium]